MGSAVPKAGLTFYQTHSLNIDNLDNKHNVSSDGSAHPFTRTLQNKNTYGLIERCLALFYNSSKTE